MEQQPQSNATRKEAIIYELHERISLLRREIQLQMKLKKEEK
jgi:hypothetical protein